MIDHQAHRDDYDWNESECRARMLNIIDTILNQEPQRRYMPVRIAKLTKGMHFVVTTNKRDDPLKFTLLDPATGAVLMKDNVYFPEPPECILLGSEDDQDGKGAMLAGVIKHNAKLVLRVNGKFVEKTGPELRVTQLTLYVPGAAPYSPWTD